MIYVHCVVCFCECSIILMNMLGVHGVYFHRGGAYECCVWFNNVYVECKSVLHLCCLSGVCLVLCGVFVVHV